MALQKARLRYHCVEIIAGPGGCKAAVELKKQRLLSADAPRLPLATCETPAQCACRYRHHDDRRAGPRRSEEQGAPRRPRPTRTVARCEAGGKSTSNSGPSPQPNAR